MSKRHEQLLFRYSSALERGEFETVAEVLREAERDPALEQAILEMNAVYAAEQTGSTNHTNHTTPKEIPMTVALYGRRASAPVQWQSLPLVAALAVIAVLTLLLAAQIRQNNNAALNTGNGGSEVPALGQVNMLCQGAVLVATDVHTRDDKDSRIVGTLPAGTYVKVLEAGIRMLDESETENGQNWMLWLFVVAEGANGVQGWIPAAALDADDCPEVSVGQLFTATPTIYVMTSTPLPTFTPTAADAVQALPTFTLVPAGDAGVVFGDGMAQYVLPTACDAVVRAPVDVMSEPSWDAQVLYSAPRGEVIRLSDYAVSVDAEGRQESWYFGATLDGTGWMLAALLDVSACPTLPNIAPIGTVPPAFSLAPMEFVTVVPADVQPIPSEVALTAMPPTVPPPDFALPTFTPSPAAFTIAPATVPPEVHVITLPATSDTVQTFPLPVCTLTLENAVDVFADVSHEAQVLERVPGGALVQVSPVDDTWYSIMYHLPNGLAVYGYALRETLGLPAGGCPTPEFTVSAVPVDTPLQLQPTVVTLGTLPVQATPQYYVYVVQQGDTLLSIMTRFGLDASAMPDVLRANNLTEDSVIAPGITLYVPTSQQLITLACKITAARTLELRVRPEMDAAQIGTLPVGAEFELIDRSQQRDGVWYAISAQVEGVTVRGAWVSPGAITVPTDCQHSVPGTVITVLPDTVQPVPTSVPMQSVLTSTPFPVDGAVLPTATATPVPIG